MPDTIREQTTSRRGFYDRTGDGYEVGRYADRHMGDYRAFRNETLARILKDNGVPTHARILEVGCGTGLTLEFLSALPARHRLFGMDLSATMLKQAEAKATRLPNPPRLLLGDAGRLPYADGLFDVVVSTRFIHQFTHDEKKRLWREFQRVTRKGGITIVEFYARPYHWLRYYLGDGAKGRSREGYFNHYPTRGQVRDVVGSPMQLYPLRVPGAKVFGRVFGDSALRSATRAIGQASGGLLIDEYFVVATHG
jgi:SAM-dependent methyltransferase